MTIFSRSTKLTACLKVWYAIKWQRAANIWQMKEVKQLLKNLILSSSFMFFYPFRIRHVFSEL